MQPFPCNQAERGPPQRRVPGRGAQRHDAPRAHPGDGGHGRGSARLRRSRGSVRSPRLPDRHAPGREVRGRPPTQVLGKNSPPSVGPPPPRARFRCSSRRCWSWTAGLRRRIQPPGAWARSSGDRRRCGRIRNRDVHQQRPDRRFCWTSSRWRRPFAKRGSAPGKAESSAARPAACEGRTNRRCAAVRLRRGDGGLLSRRGKVSRLPNPREKQNRSDQVGSFHSRKEKG
jgi:hypothetical protein